MEYLDMLAKLGIGNAHPGGFAATLEQFEQYPLPANSRILEVGCGTGRTSCYVAAQGHEVIGIDIRPDMIAKAKKRAENENVSIQFLVGDASSLPFPNESFDIILVESVSIFTDISKTFAEYYRVLRTGGKLFDREMIQQKRMPAEIKEEISQFYNLNKLWDMNEWSAFANTVGFTHSQIDGPFLFPNSSEDLNKYPDLAQQIDVGSFLNLTIWEVINKYNGILERYREYIGYILFIGTK
jgi:ubiquinone/menaquinone biosynthesis C-methylase UbiE